MRSSVINTTLLDKREYILMKNRREELDIIPNDYILEYYPKKDDVSTLTLEIPSHLRRGDIIVEYPLYENMQPRRHIVVKSDDQPIERYVVEDIDIVDEGDYKTKKVTAYGYDYTLKTKTCLINEGLTRQLYCPADEKVHVGEGILNMFENQTGWKVNHVDDMARSEMVTENVSVTKTILGEKTYETVEDNKVLFELNVDIPAEENFPLNFDIAWIDLVVTTTDGFTYDSGSIIHTFTDLSQGVKSVKATFTSNSTQRYGITYELTLDNDETETHTYAFANCRNLKLATKGVNLTYQTSQEEEKLVVKYRYLEYGQSYWYQYLKTTVQEAFNVYITFNSYDKTINVYSQEQFGKWKGFYLDYNNLLTKVNKQPDMGELCTRLWVQSNNVDITEVNPLGTSYLEDYSYFEQSGTMSISLSEALKRYYAHVEVQQVKWLEVSKLKNSTDQWLTKRNSELVKLNEQVKAKQALLTAYLKADNNEEGQKRVAQELKELEAQVSEKLKQIEDLKEQSDNYLSQMQLIGKEMAKESCVDSQGKIFTKEDIEELDDLTIEQTYTDEYYTKAKGLFDHAKTIMKDKATLKYTFSLEHKDFAQNIKHPLGWEWFVEIGAKVEIPDKDIADADGFITIYAYKYSPKNKTMESVEFDNNSAVIKAVSGLASFSKIAYNTATMTDFWKETWKEAENATAIVKDIRKNGLDLAANMVRGGNTVNKISMTESGLFIIDAENEDNQIYVGSSLIAITDDRWITSKTAINTGGVIADTIVGRLLLGEQLFISNEDGSFSILPNGLSIKDSNQEEIIGLGINEEGKNYFHLGDREDEAYLIFDEQGRLDIKATSINFTVGDIPTKEEIEDIINGQLDNIIVGVRNYALGTGIPVTIEGENEESQVVKLYDLSKPGTNFMGKEMTLSFEWTVSEGATGSFKIRTGDSHNQDLTEVIEVNSVTTTERNVATITITQGENFNDLELVAINLQGLLRIESLKFEGGNRVSDWTPAPEDEDGSYVIMLSNEAQVIPVDTNRLPLKSQTFQTEVSVYRGSTEREDFTIQTLNPSSGITPRIENHTVYFEVNEEVHLEQDNGKFDIIIEIDEKTFKRSWTWAVAQQGVDGNTGEDAKYVILNGEQVFKYPNGYQEEPTPTEIRLEATVYGIKSPTYKWQYKQEEQWFNFPNETTNSFILEHNNPLVFADFLTESVQIRCVVNNEFYDEITIIKVADGGQGEDAYSVILTNESHTFPCEADGSFSTDVSTYSQIIAYKGQEKVSATVDINLIETPRGMSIRLIKEETPYEITDETSANVIDEFENRIVSECGLWLEFTALADSDPSDLANSGSIVIPISVDGIEFRKVFSWSKAKKGADGEKAKVADIIASSQIFKSEDGKTFMPEVITLTPILQNVDFVKWQYSTSGGLRWTDVVSGNNGIVVDNKELTLSHDSNLFTNTVTSLVFKLISSEPRVYDTMSIAKLSDGNIGNVEIGMRNWLSGTGKKKTVLGNGKAMQTEHLYYLVEKDCLPLMGKTVTFSCDYRASGGSIGKLTFETDGEYRPPATTGYGLPLTDTISLNDSMAGHVTKTITLTEDVSMGFSGVQLRLDNVVGEVTIENCILTIGNVHVDWSPAPEDGTDYTNELIDELRRVDLQQIIEKNEESNNRIEQILSDNIITSSEKVNLSYDFERATIDKNSAINYYNAVNDTSMYNLKVSMEESYNSLSEILAPILENMNTNTNTNGSAVKNAFKDFYISYEGLMSALQNSVMVIITKHSTKIEQLETEISFTASKTEIMEDKVNQYDAHLKFSAEGFVELYATQNGQKGAFSTQITDQKLSFKENEVEVAYVSNQELRITKATVENQMQLADFVIRPSGKRGIVFAYVGD